jgi:hypothetical protein
MADAVACFWSANVALDAGWRSEVECFVGAVPGVVLAAEEGETRSIKRSDGVRVGGI